MKKAMFCAGPKKTLLPALTFCSWYHRRNSEGFGASSTWQVRRSVDPLSRYSSRPAVMTARGSERRAKHGGDGVEKKRCGKSKWKEKMEAQGGRKKIRRRRYVTKGVKEK